MTALNRHWCEGHFCCLGCDDDLATVDGGKYFDWDGAPMCKSCYKTLPSVLQRKLTHYSDQERKVRAEKEKAAAKAAKASA